MCEKLRQVVITGMGVLAPNGNNMKDFFEACLHGKSGIKKITLFDASDLSTQIAGQISDFNPQGYIDEKKFKRMARFTQLSVVSAKMALEDAGLQVTDSNRDAINIILGVSGQDVKIISDQLEIIKFQGPDKVNPFTLPIVFPNAAAMQLSIELGVRGSVCTISTGCSSALNAVGYAFERIRAKRADIVIAGGTESSITRPMMAACCASHSLSKRNQEPEKASRPFDRSRDGYVMSEASAVLIVESLESALKRNAKIYAEVTGYGTTSDAYNMFKMEDSGEQAARAMHDALKESCIKNSEIDYISAHGSSSYVADIKETRAIKKVFHDYSRKLKISSIKSMIGHPLGAAGAVQLVSTILAAQQQYIFPTVNYEKADPQCDLDYVPNEAVRKKIRNAMINTFGMGGNNTSMVLRTAL